MTRTGTRAVLHALLRKLFLNSNKLSGSLPPMLGVLTNLAYVRVNGCVGIVDLPLRVLDVLMDVGSCGNEGDVWW